MERVEEYAVQIFLRMGESEFVAFFGLIVLGFILSAIFNKKGVQLRRAPFFAYINMLGFFGAASGIIWLYWPQALLGGFIWALLLLNFIIYLGIGYIGGKITMARSLDGFGTRKIAVISFVPILNLLLLFKRSKSGISPAHVSAVPLLNGGMGIITGLFFLILSVSFNSYLELEMTRINEDFQNYIENNQPFR